MREEPEPREDPHWGSIPVGQLCLCVSSHYHRPPTRSREEASTGRGGGSSTMREIRAHLPTVSLADEWQRQEERRGSQLGDALGQQECICRSAEEAEE